MSLLLIVVRGGSSIAPSVGKPSPKSTSSRLKRLCSDGDLIDLILERAKSTFLMPPVFHQLRFFEGNFLEFDRYESLHLEEIDRPFRRLLLA